MLQNGIKIDLYFFVNNLHKILCQSGKTNYIGPVIPRYPPDQYILETSLAAITAVFLGKSHKSFAHQYCAIFAHYSFPNSSSFVKVLGIMARQQFSHLATYLQADLSQTLTLPLRNIHCLLGNQPLV